MNGRLFAHILLLGYSFVLVIPTAHAQITNVTGDQAPPIPGAGHDYIHMIDETVNPATGAVSIRISVPSPPGRGISVPFSFGYDSNAAHHFSAPASFAPADNPGYLSKGGWSYLVPQLSMLQKDNYWFTQSPVQRYDCYYFTDYMFTDLGGGSHALGISTTQPPTAYNCTGIRMVLVMSTS
jgi:hypothetical protein